MRKHKDIINFKLLRIKDYNNNLIFLNRKKLKYNKT